MNKQRARQLYELADRLSKLDVNTLSEQQLAERNAMVARLKEEVRTIKEFAPDSGDSGEEDTLHKYARMWYNGNDATQQQVEKVLARMGWEIGEIESEEGGAFVIRPGDENGDSYIGFTVSDLTEGVTEGLDRLDSFTRKVLNRMEDDSWLSAERAYFIQKGAQEKAQRNREQYDQEIQRFIDLYRQYMGQQGVAEGEMSPMAKDSIKADKIRSLKNLIAIAKEQGRGVRAQELELELKKLQSVSEADNAEYDDEAGMSHNSLRTISRAVEGLMNTIKPGDNLPEWVQAKLSIAEEDLVTIWDYLQSEKEQGVTEDAPELAKMAGGLGVGLVAAAGAPVIVGILGPLLGIPFAAYSAYSAAKLGMKGVEKLWDMAAEKLGGDDKVEQYTISQIAKLPPEKAHAAQAAIKQISESRTGKKSLPVSEEINKEAYERLQKVFAFKNYES